MITVNICFQKRLDEFILAGLNLQDSRIATNWKGQTSLIEHERLIFIIRLLTQRIQELDSSDAKFKNCQSPFFTTAKQLRNAHRFVIQSSINIYKSYLQALQENP